jgi:hypothetical protein
MRVSGEIIVVVFLGSPYYDTLKTRGKIEKKSREKMALGF